MSLCIYAVKTPDNAGKCGLKLCDKPDLLSCCESCTEYTGPARGLGDKIKSVTQSIGVKTCGGCQARREALNRWSRKRQEKKRSKEQAT